MSDEKPNPDPRVARARVMRFAAIMGVVAGLICHGVPHQYQAPCGVVLDVVSLSCGAK